MFAGGKKSNERGEGKKIEMHNIYRYWQRIFNVVTITAKHFSLLVV